MLPKPNTCKWEEHRLGSCMIAGAEIRSFNGWMHLDQRRAKVSFLSFAVLIYGRGAGERRRNAVNHCLVARQTAMDLKVAFLWCINRCVDRRWSIIRAHKHTQLKKAQPQLDKLSSSSSSSRSSVVAATHYIWRELIWQQRAGTGPSSGWWASLLSSSVIQICRKRVESFEHCYAHGSTRLTGDDLLRSHRGRSCHHLAVRLSRLRTIPFENTLITILL